MTVGTIARLTFREASRRKILLAALVLGVLFLVIYGVGMYLIRQDMLHSARSSQMEIMSRQLGNFMTLAGLYSVNFLTVMMTVLTSVDTVAGEISTGTIHTVVSKPLRRWEVLVGKWLGYSGLLSGYLVLMAGGVLLLSGSINGYVPAGWVSGLVLLWLNAMLILCLSLLGGTYLSTLANGVMVFGLFGIAFVGGWIEQIGGFMNNQTAINVGIISSLILPSEA
jgi:ABC-type transport system involved in multi-copper enzyme maturation permease subunit